LVGVLILVTGNPAIPQEAPKRDCVAAAAAQGLRGAARRHFLIACLREGGTITCSPRKKPCGVDCIFKAKACTRPDLRMR
jgi:hypothetical protein